MDTAINMQGNVIVNDDGTWSYTWNWTYSGTQALDGVHEEFLITDTDGLLIDYKKDSEHSVDPGQTYLGTGFGNRNIPPENRRWKLHVIRDNGYLGVVGDNF